MTTIADAPKLADELHSLMLRHDFPQGETHQMIVLATFAWVYDHQHEIGDALRSISALRALAIEEAAKCVDDFDNEYNRKNHASFVEDMRQLAVEIRALSPTIDLDSMVEIAAEAIWEAYRNDEHSPAALPLKWSEMPDDLKRIPRIQAQAVIQSLMGK